MTRWAACVAAIIVVTTVAATQLSARDPAAAAEPPPAPCLFAFSSRLAGDAQQRRFLAVGSRLSVLAPNWYELDPRAGTVRGDPAIAPVRRAAAERGTAVWPVVNAQLRFAPLFASTVARERAVRAITTLAGRERFAGITLDVEGVRPADRAAFTALVRSLSSRMHRAGRRVAVYVIRRTGERPNRSAAAYDWRALIRSADLVLASGYNEHAAYTDPGPITTPQGFAQVLRYARTVSTRRVVPLAGAFGYRWPLAGGPGRLVAAADAVAERRRLDAPTRTAGGAATYAAQGDRVWFETGAGLRSRAKATRRARMRWFGLFSLGREPAGTLERLPRGDACARWAR